MRATNSQQVLVRRQIQTTIGSGILQLPDEFMIGKNAETSKFRICDVVWAPEEIKGSQVVVHETSSQSLDLVGDKVHRAPIEFVLAYISEGEVFPLRDVVLVKPDPKEENIPGSFLLMPEFSRRPSQTGKVLAVGPKCREVKVGDRVMFGLFTGVEFEHKGESLLLVRESPLPQHVDEIVGILVDEQ